jgi:hypothetical protein
MSLRASLKTWPAVAVPFAVFLAHAALFGGWIIDDAAIGFAYARNLAAGHGLVAQPGAEAVEGYSDFLRVVLMVPFFWAGLFHPVVTPKVISAVLVLLTFLVVRRCLRQFGSAGPVVVGLTLTLLAINSSFVVWTVSGLENPLYVLLAVVLLWRGLVVATAPAWTAREAALCAVVATAVALTRPDGAVYAVAVPLVVLGRWAADRHGPRVGAVARFLMAYTGTLGFLLGGFLLFRFLYFHDLVPNTYHAKSASPAGSLHDLALLDPGMVRKANDLLDSVLGTKFRPALLAALAVLGLWAVGAGRLGRAHLVWLLFMGLSAGVFLLLPGDWMPLFRFATPFLVFFLGFWVSLAGECLRSIAWPAALRQVVAGAAALAALGEQRITTHPRQRPSGSSRRCRSTPSPACTASASTTTRSGSTSRTLRCFCPTWMGP